MDVVYALKRQVFYVVFLLCTYMLFSGTHALRVLLNVQFVIVFVCAYLYVQLRRLKIHLNLHTAHHQLYLDVFLKAMIHTKFPNKIILSIRFSVAMN